jgi:hypothetical protein
MQTQSADYYLILSNRIGQTQEVIQDFAAMEYAKTVNQVGALSFKIPIKYLSKIQFLYQITIMRRAYGGKRYQEFGALWLITKRQVYMDAAGVRWIKVGAVCGNILLAKRDVAYYAASANAAMTGFAGNLMKQVCRDNMGSTANDFSGTANVASGSLPAKGIPTAYFGIDANTGDGASITVGFSWQTVLDALSDMAILSYQSGSYMAFDMVNDAQGHLQFQTFPNQRGSDRRWKTSSFANPVILDPLAGNLVNYSLTYDWGDFASFIYAAGQGQETARVVGTSYDVDAINSSPFGRWEKVIDARNVKTQTEVNQQAKIGLQDSMVGIDFTAEVVDSPGSVYGINYFWGDLVTVQVENDIIDCYVDYVGVTINPGTSEGQGIESKRINLRKY